MPASAELYQQIVESTLDGLWLVDAHGRTTYANPRVAELIGRSEDELPDVRIGDVLAEEERADYVAHLDELARGHQNRRAVERMFRRPDGTAVALLVNEQVLCDEAGQVVGYLHRLVDDSRRRALVDELSRSRSQLAEAQAIARVGSWEIQVEPREVTWSREMYDVLDVDPDTFVAGPDEFIGQFVDEDRDLVAAEWAGLPAAEGERSLDARIRLSNGSERWVRTIGRVLERAPDGRPQRFGGTVQDIDALKRTELQLREAVELNTFMQFMAAAANEASTLDEALRRLRDLLLADKAWERGVAFTVAGDELRWRRLGPDDDCRPRRAELAVALRALDDPDAFVVDESAVPGHLLVAFPVALHGVTTDVLVISARSAIRHRSMLASLAAQVAGQLAHVAAREELVAEITRSRSQLAEAQSIARLGSWDIRIEPYEIAWSSQLYDILGVDPTTFRAGLDEFLDMVVESDRPILTNVLEEIALEEGEQSVDVRITRADGEERWVRAVGRALEWAPDGAPLRFGGTVQDIDALKRAELQLLDAVDLNTIMQFMASAANETSTLDEALARTRELLLAHPDWKRGVAFDVAESGLSHRPVGPDDPVRPTSLERQVAERVLAEGGVVFEEHADPQYPLLGFPVTVRAEPIVVIVITNTSPFVRHALMRSLVAQVSAELSQVAQREAAAAELSAARDLAMAASTAKSEFLATMSHEIRTPLNGVIGLNDLLLRTQLDPDQRQLAEAMQGAARTLLVLISDILDFSKIEAGGLELEAVVFQPTVVVRGMLELFEPMATVKGIALDVEVDAGVPERLEGDPSRFGQVLSNLVSNAVKFTDEGGVHVKVSATTEEEVTTLRVAVRDTGIGMDDEQLARIFQPFRQADASTTRTHGGTGLGLSIAHRLASALGGRIGVASVPGEGSTFWFTGKFRKPGIETGPASRAPLAADEDRTGGHVLVVEDNEVNQLVAVGMLDVLGYTSEVAADGAAAAARATGGRFDAVLMDLQMPRLDGYAATRLIRQSEPPGVRVPIIALTASATSGEQQRCLDAGMTGFLSKPVSVEALGRVLREQLAGAAQPVVPQPVVPQPVVPAGAEVAVVAEPAPRTTTPTLDTDRLAELADMGAEALPLIQRAIDNFVDDADEHLDALRRATAAGDDTVVRAAAHRLKGSAANLGAVRVAEVALELEELGAAGDLAEAPVVLEELADALLDATTALAAYRLDAGPAGEPVSA